MTILTKQRIYSGLLLFFLFILVTCNGFDSMLDDPGQHITKRTSKTPHDYLFSVDGFKDGPAVTRACLKCHPSAAEEVMKTAHWTWLGEPESLPGKPKPVRLGKKNLINNFCIGIESNWPKCTQCHAGYAWTDASYDFSKAENVDCLVCHDHTGLYEKTDGGLVNSDVDLLAVAKSVGWPSRDNCGYCHFNGGGGDAVKHGDLDGSMSKPVERIDVHMGRNDFLCIDCHTTSNHKIAGESISVSVHDSITVRCIDCHSQKPHRQYRLNDHTATLACQTCHIPWMAVKRETKMAWDWSTAGKDVDSNDTHKYMKKKGTFLYAKKIQPEYFWFNGSVNRYLKGDKIDPHTITHLNFPLGHIEDPEARIWPFKVHRAKQPFDKEYEYLIIPKTVGKGGFWTEFDWDKAARLGSEHSGLSYSGSLGFAETDMHWALSHMVTPGDYALQCIDCHGEGKRFAWISLGYEGDPAFPGGRKHRRIITRSEEMNK